MRGPLMVGHPLVIGHGHSGGVTCLVSSDNVLPLP